MSDNPNLPALKAHGVALHEAIHLTYAAITAVKRLVGEHRPRKEVMQQLELVVQALDAAYTEACVQEIALYDLARMTLELRRAYDELGEDAETAWQQGWQAAMKELFATARDLRQMLEAEEGV